MSTFVKVDNIKHLYCWAYSGGPRVPGVDITIGGHTKTFPVGEIITMNEEEIKLDVFNLFATIINMDLSDRLECFGSDGSEIFKKYTYNELKEKYNKWLRSKEIHKLTVEEIEEKLGYKVEIVS